MTPRQPAPNTFGATGAKSSPGGCRGKMRRAHEFFQPLLIHESGLFVCPKTKSVGPSCRSAFAEIIGRRSNAALPKTKRQGRRAAASGRRSAPTLPNDEYFM